MGSNKDPINIGISFGEAKNIHLEAYYDIRRRIASVIESAGMTGTQVNYDVVYALVELAISSIPDTEQGNKCRQLMEKWEREVTDRLASRNDDGRPTADDIQAAKRSATMATLNLVQVIYDDDIGIRTLHTIGTV